MFIAYFVTEATKPGPIARAMQKVLDELHSGAIRQVMEADVAALPALWEEFCASGRVAGGYWALLSRSDLPDALCTRIFGEVHMMSHLLGRSTQRLASKASDLEERLRVLEATLARERQRHAERIRERDRRIVELENRARSSQQPAPAGEQRPQATATARVRDQRA